MIVIDKALEDRERANEPVRVAMVGAGFMGRGVALQIATATRGMRLVAIANRHIDTARRAFSEAGESEIQSVDSNAALQTAMSAGRPVVTEDPLLLCAADRIDAVLEVTGSIEHAAGVVSAAIDHGKHVILMNAELDGTVGPLLKRRADAAGVVYSNVDGDQPGVTMNLYRFVRGIGVRPVLCGNIKGLHDPYRTPETQREFARRWGQNPHMVTSFADGTKISFEQAVVANATGMRVAHRGMFGFEVPAGTPVEDAARLFPSEALLDGSGIVDYVVGATPPPGVFVLGTIGHAAQRHYLNLYKLGEGPFYCFSTACHLCHFEVPNTIARAALFGDATIAPAGAPMVEVVATAKRNLRAGETIDEIGGFMTYGQAENALTLRRLDLLPMGLASGCRLRRDVPKDTVLARSDVDLPAGRLIDRLRGEQDRVFAPEPALA